MVLSELKRGDRALVLKVEQPAAVKERLKMLKIFAGAKITVLKVSLRRGVFLVEAYGGKVALGRGIAEGVRVCRM